MLDPDQLLAANLTEALKQVQNYVSVALGASVSALALTTRFASRDPVKPPGTFVAVDPELAQVVLLGLVFVVGVLAAYAAEAINVAAGQLDPKLLRAACSFPSVAASPHTWVRASAALLPFIISLTVVIRSARSAPAVGGWLLLGGSAYGFLLLQLLHSSCLLQAP